jgi:hypothetical protein
MERRQGVQISSVPFQQQALRRHPDPEEGSPRGLSIASATELMRMSRMMKRSNMGWCIRRAANTRSMLLQETAAGGGEPSEAPL